MPAHRALSILSCVLASSALVAAPAFAADQDLARARVLDQQGVRAYREERYNDAIRFFEEALKVGGPPSEIWNIAKCHVHMDEPEEGAKYIEEYLSQKGISPNDRAEAEQQLHEIQHRHSTLTVASSPAGATVYLEGHRWAGVTPATIDVPPGDHKLTIELAGYDPSERSITAKFGRAVIVDVRLSKNDSAPAGVAPAVAHPPPPGDTAPHPRPRSHRLVLAAEIGVSVPQFGSIGGSAAPAGYLSGAYVPIDDAHVVVALGAGMMFTGDSWSNTSGLPNTNANCGATISNSGSATAVSAFFEGGISWHAAPRWRLGGDFGLGVATYSISEAGRDVFFPSCRPSPGVKPAVHFDGVASYALSSELRLLFSPFVLELQPAFDGTSNAPKDATGLWLRFGAAAGLAFDLF
jgi:PEGA domain